MAGIPRPCIHCNRKIKTKRLNQKWSKKSDQLLMKQPALVLVALVGKKYKKKLLEFNAVLPRHRQTTDQSVSSLYNNSSICCFTAYLVFFWGVLLTGNNTMFCRILQVRDCQDVILSHSQNKFRFYRQLAE